MFKKELLDNKLKEYLEKALTNEAIAHVKYKLFASDAEEKGFIGLAKMFRAFADAEFYHARNHFYVLNKMESIEKNLKNSNENETYEIDVMYKDFLEYSLSQKHGLASYTFFDALEAEKIHQKLVCEAIESFNNNKDVADDTYYTCSSCGQTFKGIKPQNCHICGAPSDKIFEVK
ncbi:MAG: hypothetical protein A2086_10915 [Spirochaetes bacterium GWD1_27_9]|nr:MAG: hypothetical protein A2Z98_08205 [Spirochaetes bacterium GWB1_27_13]OHD27776.1 MAG: hypothetical protein A2Y34_08935 [Spirochaetes bacterium GWC1_27_15]OHD45444.1 MAG: hypothetical protein A2086_10915 [Spirochaetes bacterium GWD1_27_9]